MAAKTIHRYNLYLKFTAILLVVIYFYFDILPWKVYFVFAITFLILSILKAKSDGREGRSRDVANMLILLSVIYAIVSGYVAIKHFITIYNHVDY